MSVVGCVLCVVCGVLFVLLFDGACVVYLCYLGALFMCVVCCVVRCGLRVGRWLLVVCWRLLFVCLFSDCGALFI